jgi:hypothetical protein
MARIMGEPARYVTDQAIKKLKKELSVLLLTGYCLAFGAGCMVGLYKQRYSLAISVLLIAALPILFRKMGKFADRLERDRINFRKGAVGEALVGDVLDRFPDDYRVIHDLTTSFGNIDHVVVGPSGAYVIDTKNWKGVVTADGKGGLLLNGQATPKPEARNLSRTIMAIKEKVKVLSGLDVYMHGILAFPSARVEARWGTTGHVHCMRDEQLFGYIVENRKGRRLGKQEIESISQAFLALAVMDKDFAPVRTSA